MTIDQPVMLGGRYRVENELGRGGMAKVYRGQDTVLGRTVAIKILAPQYAEDQGFVQRFRREAQAAARISNQTIVSVFDTGSDDGVHFIVMEYVEGRTLADYLTGGGRIMPDRAIDIAIDVARALEAAHAQGVIHRDIKPGNIMLDGQGDVKVTDFGIARVTATAETVAQTAGVGTTQVIHRDQPAQTAVLPPTGPPEQEERSRWWIPVLVTLLILGLLGIVLFFLAQNLLEDEQPQAQMVSVPDVVGDPRRRWLGGRPTGPGERHRRGGRRDRNGAARRHRCRA